jgi:hypothetical protein
MKTNLIEFRQVMGLSHEDLPRLQGILAELVGEPFQFARVSYGDELTLHFGDLRPARSPKLRERMYGAYILGMRGSPWVLKSGLEPVVLCEGVVPVVSGRHMGGRPVSKEEVEEGRFIERGSRVLRADPFPVRPVEGVGLQLRLSDGSALIVLPTVQEPDDPEDRELPELADWELISPRGFLKVGPGYQWSFEPHQPASPRRPA